MAAKRSKNTPISARPAGDQLGLESFRSTSADEGISLDRLSAAIAGMLSTGETPYQPAVSGDSGTTGLATEPHLPGQTTGDDDVCPLSPRTIFEAMLFVGSPDNQPLSARQAASLMRGVRPAEIDSLVRELNVDYERRRCPYTIVGNGAGYRMTLREDLGPLRDRFHGKVRQARLSQAAIEVLAAVAYNAPITGDEVNRLRGVPSGPILLQLVRRGLLAVERSTPRRHAYRTTSRFLELFSLESLDDLPRSYELEET